jgi:hypothetical protein
MRKKLAYVMLVLLAGNLVILSVLQGSLAFLQKEVRIQSTGGIRNFYFGTGPEAWNLLKELNEKYNLTMMIATNWINSRADLYGWWSNSFFPDLLWKEGYIPHIITWRYFAHSWGIDYSSSSIARHYQDWLTDLSYMANRLKAPDDGNHTVLISLETEFNSYGGMNYTFWNQLMIDSRNTIKQIAPNVLVSYSMGGWAWRWGDVGFNGTLVSSMQQMDFMSFQCMWGVYEEEQTKWMNGDDLKTSYNGVNWVKKFGDKPHIWDYVVCDIAGNVFSLQKYNKRVFLAHLSLDTHLWGIQSQVDALDGILENLEPLENLGLFGISLMRWRDIRWDEWAYWTGDIGQQTGGLEYPDGTPKPGLYSWMKLTNFSI